MEIRDILSLMQAVSDHGLSEFQLDDGKVKLSFKKDESAAISGRTVMGQASAVVSGGLVGASAGQSLAAGNVVKAPLVGTFYSAPSPEAECFVKVGDTVKKGQTLAIIEAMKLMNEIESDFDGVVEEILVSNEAVVEYGQPLFRIR